MIDRPLELIRSKDVSAVCEREKSFEKKKEKKRDSRLGKKNGRRRTGKMEKRAADAVRILLFI